MSVAGVGKGHTHELPRTLLTILKALVGAVVALLLATGVLTYYVLQQQQYIQGRGEIRDRENERTNQRINDAICDLLDQLPEGPLLDRPRDKYGCGPGIPLEDLPEDIRRRLEEPPVAPTEPASTPATTPTTEPPMGAPAVPNPPRPTSNGTPPSTTPPKPTPTAPPSDPEGVLGPVTDAVCDLLDVCLDTP